MLNLRQFATTGTLLSGLVLFTSPGAAGIVGETLYVNHEATGSENGQDWTNAFVELGDALDFAGTINAGTPGHIKEIWVAQGTYKPTTIAGTDELHLPAVGLTDRDKSFVILDGVSMYGGFAGTETLKSERTLGPEATILSGEIGSPGTADNIYNVVLSLDTPSGTIFDNFTIMDGHAEMSPYIARAGYKDVRGSRVNTGSGGGMHLADSALTVSNVHFKANQSDSSGGGVYAARCRGAFTNVTFSGNVASIYGGGFHSSGNSTGHTTVTNALFYGNRSGTNGAAIHSNAGHITVTNVTASGNYTVTAGGAAVSTFGAVPTIHLRNAIVVGNHSKSHSGNFTFNHSLLDTRFYETTDTWSEPENVTTATLFVSPQLPSEAPANYGNYRLREGAFAIDAGDSGLFDAGLTPDLSGITTDVTGLHRFMGDAVDLGAYEFGHPSAARGWGEYF